MPLESNTEDQNMYPTMDNVSAAMATTRFNEYGLALAK
jgi:hypothetical protein